MNKKKIIKFGDGSKMTESKYLRQVAKQYIEGDDFSRRSLMKICKLFLKLSRG